MRENGHFGHGTTGLAHVRWVVAKKLLRLVYRWADRTGYEILAVVTPLAVKPHSSFHVTRFIHFSLPVLLGRVPR